MAKISLKSFFGFITNQDTKDVPADACLRMVNMVCEPNQYSTRNGCVKLSNTPFSEGPVNLIYNLEMKPQGNKTIIQVGTKLYTNE